MIKLTLGEIINVVPALQLLAKKDFPGATTFKIARLMREIEKEAKMFEEERVKIAKMYGEKDENGELIAQEDGSVKIPPDKIADCNAELTDLLNTEVEVNANKLEEKVFDNIELSPSLALTIEPIIALL